MQLTILALQVPVGGLALYTIIAALMEWDRKSELSADRAALLVTQDPDVIFRTHMKLAGGGMTDQMNVDAFVRQADEYEAHGGVIDGVMKVLNLMGRTHPFPVLRIREVRRWIDSGDYQAILDGEYVMRTSTDQASVYREILESASSYKEGVEDSNDPLMVAVRRMGEGVGAASRSVRDWVRGARDDEDDDPGDPGDGEA